MYTDESVHMGRASEASRNVSVVFVGGGGGGTQHCSSHLIGCWLCIIAIGVGRHFLFRMCMVVHQPHMPLK